MQRAHFWEFFKKVQRASLIVPQYRKLKLSVFMGTETPNDIQVTVDVKYLSIFCADT